VADPTINQPPKAEVVDNGTRIVTSRGRNVWLILLGTAAAATPNFVHYKPNTDVYESQTFIQPWSFKSRLILNAYPTDIVSGWDNFIGSGEPEPPFIQAQKGSLPVVLTQNVPYNPAQDIQRVKRSTHVDPPQEFIQPQRSVLQTSLRPNPPPAGDLTTLRRKPAVFEEARVFDWPNKPSWFVTLLPTEAPLPPPPVPPPPTPWPPPSTVTNLPGRGAWELPGGQQAIWVFGNGAFLMTVKTAASAYTPATFAMKRVGTLSTSSGPVGIRDNGAGGYVVIVDGPNGYLYNIKTQKFTQISDPAFLGADKVAFIDGWWIFNQPGTQVFYTPKSTYSIEFDASFFALADAATDKLVTLMENKEELWLICEKHTEIWYDAGGQFFGFQRLVSTMLQVGCSAPHSLTRFNDAGQDGLIWFGRSDRGENVVIRTRGFEAQVVSTPAVSDEIATYAYVADAIGYTYQEDGHEFYVLTFPSADKTWCFDGSTEMWHKRASYDPYTDSFHRHRSNCFLNFQNQRLVGDYQNGSVYQMTRNAFTDAGWPLLALRRTPHIWDGGARERVYMGSLQIEFAPGVGNQSGTGYDPQVYLKTSRDGGQTWSQMFARSLGKVGNYLNRVIWRKLAFTRDGVMEVRVIDPVKRDIVGANLKRAAK